MGNLSKNIKNPSTSDRGSSLSAPSPEPLSFYGNFVHSLDDAGRVSIPVSFRQVMTTAGENTLVLTNFITDGVRCIDGFTLRSWKSFESKLASRSRFDPQVRKLENYYLARAALCPVDASGRINIPQYLRTYAGLEREVAFTASLQGFRVWDKRVWELLFQEAESALLEDPSLFIDVDV
jgi:MraZ protein